MNDARVRAGLLGRVSVLRQAVAWLEVRAEITPAQERLLLLYKAQLSAVCRRLGAVEERMRDTRVPICALGCLLGARVGAGR